MPLLVWPTVFSLLCPSYAIHKKNYTLNKHSMDDFIVTHPIEVIQKRSWFQRIGLILCCPSHQITGMSCRQASSCESYIWLQSCCKFNIQGHLHSISLFFGTTPSFCPPHQCPLMMRIALHRPLPCHSFICTLHLSIALSLPWCLFGCWVFVCLLFPDGRRRLNLCDFQVSQRAFLLPWLKRLSCFL